VRDPWARPDLRRDGGDGGIGHAEKDEVGVAAVERAARRPGRDPLGQPGGHSPADASSAHDTH
jgi:hypothetical protein